MCITGQHIWINYIILKKKWDKKLGQLFTVKQQKHIHTSGPKCSLGLCLKLIHQKITWRMLKTPLQLFKIMSLNQTNAGTETQQALI